MNVSDNCSGRILRHAVRRTMHRRHHRFWCLAHRMVPSATALQPNVNVAKYMCQNAPQRWTVRTMDVRGHGYRTFADRAHPCATSPTPTQMGVNARTRNTPLQFRALMLRRVVHTQTHRYARYSNVTVAYGRAHQRARPRQFVNARPPVAHASRCTTNPFSIAVPVVFGYVAYVPRDGGFVRTGFF